MDTHKRNRTSRSSKPTHAERSDRDSGPERQRRASSGLKSGQTAFHRDQMRRAASVAEASAALPAASVRALLPVTVSRPIFRAFALFIMAALLMLCAHLLFAQTGTEAGSSAVPRAAVPHTHEAAFNPIHFTWNMALVVFLIFVNAFFALAEYALITVRKTRIRQLVEEGNKNAIQVERMLAHPTRMQATIQTSLTLVATFSTTIAATSAIDPLTGWLQRNTDGFVHSNAATIALFLVTLPVAILSLVIGEIAPKSLAIRHSEKLALVAVYPIRWLQALLSPVVAILTLLSNIVVRPFGGTASFTTTAVNEEELKMMVEASEEQGVLQAEETEMIHSILDFGDTVARRVMTPRIDMTALNANATFADLVHQVHQSGHSRIPVYDGDLDNIVGIVHAKDLLHLLTGDRRDNISIREAMRPPYFIPENKKIGDLLTEFRRSKQQLAIVRDEYGVTAGVVTIEDLLEEIVGDIQDEYDQEEPQVQVIDSNTSILDGKLGIHIVNDRMGMDLPEDEADTIGGFVFGLLGHQAEQGERVLWHNVEFVVEATDGRRIIKVRLIRHPDSNTASDGDTPAAREAVVADISSTNNGNGVVRTSGVETSPDISVR